MINLLNFISFAGEDFNLSLSKTRLFAVYDTTALSSLPSYILYQGKYYSYLTASHIQDSIYVVYDPTEFNSFDLLHLALETREQLTIQVISDGKN